MEENNQTVEVEAATGTSTTVAKKFKKKMLIPVIIAAVVLVAVIGTIVYIAIKPRYKVYETSQESESWEIDSFADIYFKDGSSRADVARKIPGFCVYEDDDGWEANVPVECNNYSFNLRINFNANDEISKTQSTVIFKSGNLLQTYDDYTDLVDVIGREYGISPSDSRRNNYDQYTYFDITDTVDMNVILATYYRTGVIGYCYVEQYYR